MRPHLVTLLVLTFGTGAIAADVPITAESLKLAIESRTDALNVRFVARDPAITKGAGGHTYLLTATVTVMHSDNPSIQTGFTTEAAGWTRNTATTAKYRLTTTEVDEVVVHWVKKIIVREGSLMKVATRGLVPRLLTGGNPLPGPAGVTVMLELTNGNDGSANRFCTRFSELDGSTVSLQTTYPPKFVAAHGVPVSCPPAAP